MPLGSFASADSDSRRRVVPLPRPVATMKTFSPDSSIASDVIPSPNYGERNKGRLPDMILLHYTGMPDVEGAIAQLCTPGTDVSAHYIVLEDGRIVLRRNVPSYRVLAHSDVAPSRKKDPGEKFPWHSLANSGVGHWVQPAPIVRGETLKLGTISDDVRDLQQALAKYGYGIPINGKYDGPTMEVVTAFQRHFRPARVDGVADHSTLTTLQSLLASLPTEAMAVATR